MLAPHSQVVPVWFYACIANSSMLRAHPGATDTALPPPHCSSTPWIACSHHYCLSHFLSCMQTKNRNKKSRSFSVLLFLLCSVLCVLSVSFMSHSLQNLHQLKQIQTLKQMNEQLQAENRALTRVVARLSKSIESSDTQKL